MSDERSMLAAVCTRYGAPEVLELREVQRPSPKRGDLLVRIHAAAVNSSDCFVRSGVPSAPPLTRLMFRCVVGFTRPRHAILGLVLAGEVEETGTAVKQFRSGDRVYAFTGLRFGGYAQYACIPARSIVARAPSNATYEEAAAIPYGGLLALHYLRKGEIRAGQHVMVYGASSAVGVAAVQIAKNMGANVTAASSSANVELAKSLGAQTVLDYLEDATPARRYDLVLDAVGRRKTSPLKEACRSALLPGGRYVSVDESRPRMRTRDLEELTALVEAGTLRPVIDCGYPLEQIAEAHRYVERGHKRGSVVIVIPAPGRR